MRIFLTILALICLIFIFESLKLKPEISIYKNTPPINNNSTNPAAFNTGAPNDGNCTDCHSGNPLSSNGIIDFQFSGLNQTYLPNQTYTISLSIISGQKNGFELTILDVYDNKVGHFIAGNNSIVETASGREYVLHTNSLGITTFDFTWESPTTDKGNLFAYYCFNKSNNDGTTNGDKIYMNQELITSGTIGLDEFKNIEINYNPNLKSLTLKNYTISNHTLFSVFDLSGKLLYKKVLTSNQLTLPNSITNQYIVISIQVEEGGFTEKVFIQ